MLLRNFILIVMLIPISLSAQTESFMMRANHFYQKQQYDDAIHSYNKVLDAGYESAGLYYNLGNAFYRKGNLGFAILNYERALKLAPGDEDIRHNLALANSKTIDRINTLPDFFVFQGWESFLALFTLTGWIYLSYILYLILIGGIIFYFFTKQPDYQRLTFFSGIAVIFLLILSISISIIKYNREFNIKNGIVVQQSATAKLSPDQDSQDAFVIHEGLKVKIEDKVDNYYRIRLQDGKLGWLPENDLKMI